MKILHVITSLSPRSGGPTVALRALAAVQAKQGDEVLVCTTNADNPSGVLRVQLNTPVSEDGDRVLTWYHPVKYGRSLCFSMGLAKWLNQAILNIDIVHIHGLYRFPPTYAAWRARRLGIPYLIRVHGGLDPFLYRQSSYGKWAVPLKRFYEYFFDLPNLNNASAIHYTSRIELERAAFMNFRSPAVVIPNGIDWDLYEVLPAKGSFRKSIGLGDQTPLILFLGRVNFKKGLDLLVPAFRLVLEKFPSARLAIVGPDNEGYVSQVNQWCHEQGILDNVVFVDYLEPAEVRQAYVDANVFVLPSYTENFGMTVVEAMACGCPVVVSNQVNIWQEIEEERAGLVVSLDAYEIAQAVSQILMDKNTASAMAQRGRAMARVRYSWSRVVDQLRHVYLRLIEENRDCRAKCHKHIA